MNHPFTFIKSRAWRYFVHWSLWMFTLDEMRMKTAFTPFTLDESTAMHIQSVKCKFALTHGSESIATHNPHIYCPIWVKFCTTDVHIKLLDICHTGLFLRLWMALHLPVRREKLYDISTVKNALVKSVSYVTVFTICRFATGLSYWTETVRTNVYWHMLLVYCRAT